MKRSNQFLSLLILLTVGMMLFTNFTLMKEYKTIDLSDPFKNYISLDYVPTNVLKLSGSNGYPIEVRHANENGLKVLRSRTEHVIQSIHGDTTRIEFTGASISKQQSILSETPPAIIIEVQYLPELKTTDIHCRIKDFNTDELNIGVGGHALIEIGDCDFVSMIVDISDHGHLEFFHENRVDTMKLTMTNTSVAYLKNVNLHYIKQDLGEAVSVVLSNKVFDSLVE